MTLLGQNKTRMMSILCSENILVLCAFVNIEYHNVSDGQTDGQKSHINIACQYEDGREIKKINVNNLPVKIEHARLQVT